MRISISLFFAVFATLLLGSCITATRDQLNECIAAVSAKYPSNKPMPFGQPYNDIALCMHNAGYDPDYQGQCKYRSDYTAIVSDAACYRPTNVLSGFFYDIFSVLR